MKTIVLVLIGLMSSDRSQAKKCNGVEDLCRLKFNQVTFPGTHNSGANQVMEYDFLSIPAMSCYYRNQDYSFIQQLNFGIRFFDIDTDSRDGEAWTTHNDAYGQPLKEVIRDMAKWLNQPAHRNEVVAIRFHDTDMNGYGLFDPIFSEHFSGTNGKVGMNGMWEWPTLDEAVTANKRVFIFMKDELCDRSCRYTRPYIRPSWKYDDTWEPRTVTFSCASMVGETRAKCRSSRRPLVIVSAIASLGLCVEDMQGYCEDYVKASANACYDEMKKKGRTVNFLMTDFVNQAPSGQDVVTISRQLNKLNLQTFP